MDKRSYKIKIHIKVKEKGNISEFVRNCENTAEREIYKTKHIHWKTGKVSNQ